MGFLKFANFITFAGEKMHKSRVGTAVLALLLFAMLTTNIVAAATAIPKTAPNAVSVNSQAPALATTPSAINSLAVTNAKPQTSSTTPVQLALTDNIDLLKASIPKTYDETQASILPLRTRYLMYTDNGVHIMWGFYGNGRFIGTDNNGMRAWGIYGNGVFAGFYNGNFFWGHYCNSQWKAQGLFGLTYSSGNYVLFPTITTSATTP
jgi:hypothetical protein